MTLYELNQAAYAGVPSLEDFDGARKQVLIYLKAHPSNYYLLLNNDKHYYTVFTFKQQQKFKDMSAEIVDIVRELGPIKDIVTNDNSALEFWIEYDGEITMFVLFDYARGVIEID